MDARPALAFTLEGTELLDQIRAWQQVVSRAITRRVEGSRVIATYPKDEQLLEQLRTLIATEAICCSFLEFTVDERPDHVLTDLRLPDEMPASMTNLILELMGHDR